MKAVLVMEMPENSLEYPCDDACGESCQVMDGIVEGKENMERLTYKTNGKYLNTTSEQEPPYAIDCDIDTAITKLAEYEDLEDRLQSVYGECDGLLGKLVEHIERHEGVDLPEPVFKARLLTDGEVDRWEEYKNLEEQNKLLKLRVPIGSLVYEIYQFMGNGAWEIAVHKIRLEDLDKIGKSVFLTREEAEAALKGLEGKGE